MNLYIHFFQCAWLISGWLQEVEPLMLLLKQHNTGGWSPQHFLRVSVLDLEAVSLVLLSDSTNSGFGIKTSGDSANNTVMTR